MTEHLFFEQLLIILGASLGGTLLFRRFHLPPIVAYIVVGGLVGPHLLGWIESPDNFSFIAEFGVAFLLFSIGLEFSLSKMLTLRFAVFGLGSIQVLFCSLVFALAVYLWGAELEATIVIAGALALSSTAIVSRELSEQQQFDSRYAQLSLGVLLFQDLIAVVFLILVPVLSGESNDTFAATLVLSLLKGGLLFAILMTAGKWVLPLVYNEVARGRSEEIFVLSTLVIVLLAAWLTHSFGLSMALGSFAIGMMLSEGSFKHQIISDIKPFKDILLGLFFVSVGMNIEIPLLVEFWPRILLSTLGLICLKIGVIALIVRLSGERGTTTPIRTGIVLAQAGEFGLALISLALARQLLPPDQGSFVMLIAVFSMLLSPLLIRHSEKISEMMLRYLPGTENSAYEGLEPQIKLHQTGHVLIGGFGRVGKTIAQLLEANGIPYVAIDLDIELVKQARDSGYNAMFGDCTRMEILKSCHIEKARLAILTFRSMDLAKNTLSLIRHKRIQIPIIVRCYEHDGFEELISLGADHVVPEMLEASLLISSHALTLLQVDPDLVERQLDDIRDKTLGTRAKNLSLDKT